MCLNMYLCTVHAQTETHANNYGHIQQSVIFTISISFLCHAVLHLKSLYVSLAVFCMVSFINIIFFSSLIATNAARYRMAAGRRIKLLEFGLRRAQGPDGGLSASKYAYVGMLFFLFIVFYKVLLFFLVSR